MSICQVRQLCIIQHTQALMAGISSETCRSEAGSAAHPAPSPASPTSASLSSLSRSLRATAAYPALRSEELSAPGEAGPAAG